MSEENIIAKFSRVMQNDWDTKKLVLEDVADYVFIHNFLQDFVECLSSNETIEEVVVALPFSPDHFANGQQELESFCGDLARAIGGPSFSGKVDILVQPGT